MKHKAKLDLPEKRKWLDPDTYIDLNTGIKWSVDIHGNKTKVEDKHDGH